MGHIVLRAGVGISDQTLTTAVATWAQAPDGSPDHALSYQHIHGSTPTWTIPAWLFLVYGDPPFTAGGATIPWRHYLHTDNDTAVCTVDSADITWTDIERTP
jgi:hypothetical protein